LFAGCNPPPTIPLGEGALASIPEVRAHGGLVAFDLDAAIDPATGAPAFVYRGAVGVAPTVRVAPGDEIRVTLHNRLPKGTQAPNEVNLHFHGLEVSPHAPSDDAMRLAPPGGAIAYDVRIPPSQPPGLYWYHPHAHGQTYWQITSGMAGALVVEGLQQHMPALASLRERLIVLRNIQTPPDYSTIPIAARPEPVRSNVLAARRRAGRFSAVDDDDAVGEPCSPLPGMTATINGAPRTVIGVDPGERELFRVVNASAGRYFDLSVDGEKLDLVALDGVPLDAFPGAPPVQRVRDIVIAPAGRAEFVVTGTQRPTVLRSSCYVTGDAGDRDPPVVLADLRPDGNAPRVGANANVQPPATQSGIGLPPPAARHRIVFTENASGFFINGKKYRMQDPPAIVARAGTIESWTLLNQTDEVHDFHIHQVHFAVETIDGKPIAPLHWVDTVTVPPKHYTHVSATPGSATLLMDFRNPIVRGTFVFHCHILDHEDGGMMATVRVI
jgi:suppressor of ftsI